MSDFAKPITSQELANLTRTSERYIREWLANQAAGGYLTYDPSSQRYTLPFEHAQALVNENSPAYVAGGFQVMMAFLETSQKLSSCSRQVRVLHGENMIRPILRHRKVL